MPASPRFNGIEWVHAGESWRSGHPAHLLSTASPAHTLRAARRDALSERCHPERGSKATALLHTEQGKAVYTVI